MFPRRSHLLAPLTNLTGKGRYIWNPEHQKAFNIVKAKIAQDCLLRYPDHNKPFHIYTDASDYQLGAVIVQEGIPVAYYSRKLTETQKKYTTMEKELLSIFMTCKEFETMLLGADNQIHTDHKNLTFTTAVNDRVIRQLNYIKRFGPKYSHITGDDNFLADMFSRLSRLSDADVPISSLPKKESSVSNGIIHVAPTENYSFLLDDPKMLDCFLNLPDEDELPFALDLQRIAIGQQTDQALWQNRLAHPLHYPERQFGDIRLFTYLPQPDAQWKICVPTHQLRDLIQWYHQALRHPGLHRLLQTMTMHLHHPNMRAMTEDITLHCDACQRQKLQGPQYTHLPPREAALVPWEEVTLDLIGPWTIKLDNNSYSFYALTIIDPVTNFPDAVRLQNKTALHVGLQFENLWLSRYPRPTRCIHDRGTEFMGVDFQRVLQRFGIKDVPTSVRNPQSNAICERLHQSVGNALRV
jgi:hypothetical protein